MNDLAELRAIKARLAALEALVLPKRPETASERAEREATDGLPVGFRRDPFNMVRNAAGQRVVLVDGQWLTPEQAANAGKLEKSKTTGGRDLRAEAEAGEAYSREGLSEAELAAGIRRDPTGKFRDKSGQQLYRTDSGGLVRAGQIAEDAALDEIRAAQAADHRANVTSQNTYRQQRDGGDTED